MVTSASSAGFSCLQAHMARLHIEGRDKKQAMAKDGLVAKQVRYARRSPRAYQRWLNYVAVRQSSAIVETATGSFGVVAIGTHLCSASQMTRVMPSWCSFTS
jgi:hypothetical protein